MYICSVLFLVHLSLSYQRGREGKKREEKDYRAIYTHNQRTVGRWNHDCSLLSRRILAPHDILSSVSFFMFLLLSPDSWVCQRFFHSLLSTVCCCMKQGHKTRVTKMKITVMFESSVTKQEQIQGKICLSAIKWFQLVHCSSGRDYTSGVKVG